MDDETWKYVENQFEVVTSRSYKQMNAIMADHHAKLDQQKADPNLAPIAARTKTQLEAWKAVYTPWSTASGAYKGSTTALEAKMKDLSGKRARHWESALVLVYDKGTPEHTATFPNGREPFQRGTYEQRIQAVQTLGGALQPYIADASVLALQTKVNAFHTEIQAARDAQQGAEGVVDAGSDEVEEQRVECADLLYGNLGSLMWIYRKQKPTVASFFDLKLLRKAAKDNPLPPPVNPVP